MEKLLRRPWLIVAIVGAITVFFALQLPRAQLDNNNFRFVPQTDKARIESKKIDDTFGSQILILVGLERQYGSVLDADFLARLRDYGEKAKALPLVGTVTSMIDTDYIAGRGDSVVVEPLVPAGFTGTAPELAALKERLQSWDLYSRSLVSDDFSSTQVILTLDTSTENAGSPEILSTYKEIKRLAEAEGFADTKVYAAGLPVLSSEINDAMGKDLIFLIPLVAIVVIGVLFLSFRRLGGVLLPLLTVLVAVVWAMGAMPLFGVRLSIISTVLPVILMAVGSAYGIHVVSHYYDEMAGRVDIGDAEHRQIILAIIRKIGWPVFLAALTTFAGFVSFCFTTVVPIFEFGIFSSIGVIVSFIVAITLIPALLIIQGPPKARKRGRKAAAQGGAGPDALSSAIADVFVASSKKKRTTLAISGAIVLVSCLGLSRLVIDNVMVEYFKPGTEVVKSENFIRERFGGSKSVSLVLSGEKPGDVLRPEVLGAMDDLSAFLAAKVPAVGKTSSFTDLVKRVNQVVNADSDPAGIPKPSTKASSGDGAFGLGASSAAEPAFGFGFDTGAASTAQSAAPVAAAAGSAGAAGAKVAGKASLDPREAAALLGKALSLSAGQGRDAAALVRGLQVATNYEGAAYYEIPRDPVRYGKDSPEELKALVSNYLVLLAGGADSFSDDALEPRAIRMNIQLRTRGQIDTDEALAKIRLFAAERFPKDIKVTIGGTALVEASLNRLVVQSQLWSVGLSLLMVFLILAIYYRSAIAGLIGLAPLSLSILINFAVMGFAGIKLNIGTAMVASISVGIGIDYTIHYMAAYHREYLVTGGKGDFLRLTFLSSGKAIIFNATSVGLGFAVLALSQFRILAALGGLMALTMATSAIVSLTLLPVLLDVLDPKFIKRPLSSDRAEKNMEAA